VKVADLLDIVAGELEDVRGYVLQDGHNVHSHLVGEAIDKIFNANFNQF
jgi:hypothetical protein